MSHYNSSPPEHLGTLLSKNAAYGTSLLKNDLIDVIRINTEQSNLTDEIVKAKFFSIMAYVVILSNDETLSIYFRSVDGNKDIRETFLELLEIPRSTGLVMRNVI